jgi:hypothetical protein
LTVLFISVLAVATYAQSVPPRPSGSVSTHQVQIAFIGSGTTGGGALYFRGRGYPLKLGSVGISGIGISTIDAVGTIYNLYRLEDFNGVYGQAQTGWAIGEQGKRRMRLQNSHGVYLQLHAERSGLALSLGVNGTMVQLGA